MASTGSNDPPGWISFLTAAPTSAAIHDRVALVKPLVAQIQGVLDANLTHTAGSEKLSAVLAVGTLNAAVAALDPVDSQSYWKLVAVNDVVGGSDRRLALVLVECNFFSSLWRLHQKVGNLSHRLSQAIVLLVCSITLRAEGAAGSMEALAAQPELSELLVSHLTFLAVTPDVLLSPAGLGTAQRCLQTCWELTRVPTPKCKAFRELLVQLSMSGRALQIAAAAVGRAGGGVAAGSEAAEAAAAITAAAALEDWRGGAAPPQSGKVGPAAVLAAADDDGGAYEDRFSLAAQACSFAANLAGLGNRGIELSAAGLAPQRAWLLKPGTLATLRTPLEGLAEGLESLRRLIEAHCPEGAGGGGGELPQQEAAADGGDQGDADLRPGRISRKKLLGHVEGAVRNLLMLLGLPTIVMGTGEEDVVESCGFVIRHSFGLFSEGYVDAMRLLRAAVSDPPCPQGFTAPYPGDYAAFFRAFAGHLETMATALGVQLEDWGVRFTGEQAARDLPVMEVGEGVDARIAHSWLKDQIQQIINWGHAMMMIVRMADQAKMAAAAAGPQQQQGQACCAACGAAPQAGGPPLLWCGRCRSVRYCSRPCQVGHWPQHKGGCQAAAAAAAAATAGAAAPGAGMACQGQREGRSAVEARTAAIEAGPVGRSADAAEGEGAGSTGTVGAGGVATGVMGVKPSQEGAGAKDDAAPGS